MAGAIRAASSHSLTDAEGISMMNVYNFVLLADFSLELPSSNEIRLTPLMWKELLDGGTFANKAEFLDYLKECNKDGRFEDFAGIDDRIFSFGWKGECKKLMRTYYLLEALKRTGSLRLRYNLWQHFEDLVGEMLRVALRKHQHMKVVNVDKLPGFQGLDWIVANEHNRGVWRLGIQCKLDIVTSHSAAASWASPWRATSALRLVEHSQKLEGRFGIHKRFALVSSSGYRNSKSEKQRWQKLKREGEWDIICVFESRRCFKLPYTFNLSLDTFDNIVKAAF